MMIDRMRIVAGELAEVCRVRDVKILTVGELEWPGSNSRCFVSLAIPHLARAGFNVYALELPIATQPIFDAFQAGTMNRQQLEYELDQPDDSGYGFTRLYVEERNQMTGGVMHAPDPFYFGAIESAHTEGMNLRAVDENRMNRRYSYRDQHMAEAVASYVCRGDRVVLFGGLRHHYVRDDSNRGYFQTVNELLSQRIDNAIYSVLLEDYYVEFPVHIDTATALSRTDPYFREGRCPYGPCASPEQPTCLYCGIAFDFKQSYAVTYGNYDAVVRLPSRN